MNKIKLGILAASLLIAGAAFAHSEITDRLRQLFDDSAYLTNDVVFPANTFVFAQGGDVALGRNQFGLSDDDHHIDNTLGGLFEGPSAVYEGTVPTNGKVCASCHRPESFLRLPKPPLTDHIAADDPVLTGQDAEAQGDPRALHNFEQLGLTKTRVNRFNPLLPQSSPFRKVFGWRKTQTIINLAFTQSLLTDGRARHGIEQARGAVFNHTQVTDKRFDDIANPKLANIAAYQMTEFSQPELADLLDPSAPLHRALVADPFYTVNATTHDQKRGQKVFERYCMTCHNTPNVFGHIEHVPGSPANFPPVYGRTMDVGVAQQNRHNLDFRWYNQQTGAYEPIVLPLIAQDGTITNIEVVDDLGTAFVSGRVEDLHRFRVPQLRMIKDLGPYFHDDSASTLEEVVDYFTSDAYNHSADGSQHLIHLNHIQRAHLLEFLKIL